MREELTIQQDNFWRLMNREQFLLLHFHAHLRYRISATNNEYVYVQVNCDDKTSGEHAKQYILSYIEPKHTKPIPYPLEYKQILCDDALLNRLMKEYLVHIEIKDHTQSHMLIFHSTTLTVLFLAIDDFRKAISNVHVSDATFVMDTQSALKSLSNNFERQLTTVDENDQLEVPEIELSATKTSKIKQDHKNSEQPVETFLPHCIRQEPKLKISFPGAESNTRDTTLKELIDQSKTKRNAQSRENNKRQQNVDVNDNDLVREMRQKLAGRTLRDVIIDGANIGRTYGDSVFLARGIKLAVDLFCSYGYPDSKIVVVLPSYYLLKDKEHILSDLIRRKIIHKAFEQKIDGKNKRFYDDRLIVDVAVMRNGIILSNDFYRDLLQDSGDAVRKTIRERLLCYRFIGDNLCLPNPVSEGSLPLDTFLTM